MSSPGSSAVIVDSENETPTPSKYAGAQETPSFTPARTTTEGPANPPAVPTKAPAAGAGTPDGDQKITTGTPLPSGPVYAMDTNPSQTPAPAPTAPPYGSIV